MDYVNEAIVSMLSLNELLAMKSAKSADELILISEMLKKCSEELRVTEKDRRIKQEAQRQKQIERSKREREARDAHISEVTSMDLPLDWQNTFDTDERTRGVHAESISDGLILFGKFCVFFDGTFIYISIAGNLVYPLFKYETNNRAFFCCDNLSVVNNY